MKNEWKLIVCLKDCVKIYSENGQSLLGHIALIVSSQKKKEADKNGVVHYFSSATKIEFNSRELIGVCNSLGEVVFIEQIKDNFLSWSVLLSSLAAKPTVIIYCQTDNYLCVANIEGKLCLYSIKDAKKIELAKEIDINNKKTPITCIGLLERKKIKLSDSNILITGDFIGKIMMFNLKNFENIVEINSHTRLITSLDTKLEPTMEILTGSEDSFLNYWKIEEDEKDGFTVSLKVSFRIADQIIVGAKYLKNSIESVISIYDSNEITVLKYEKN